MIYFGPIVLASFLGLVSFLVGACYPRQRVNYQHRIFRPREWEANLYRFLRVNQWKDRVPDMSKLFSIILRKDICGKKDLGKLPLLIKETCVAEIVHVDLTLIGFFSWNHAASEWGSLIWFIFMIGNIPFILIQRYNRPRLEKLEKNLRKRYVS